MSQERTAKFFRIGGAAAVVALGACVHGAAETLPLGQIMAGRAGISLILILIYGLLTAPVQDLLPRRWRPHLFRGAIACVAMALSYLAYARLPVTQAQTLFYLAPILVIPFALYRLRERPGLRILLAVLLGFLGVLLVLGLSLEAGPEALTGALAGVGAAVLIAAIQVTVRAMTATETSLSIAMSFTVIVVVVAGLSAFAGNWVWPEGAALLWLLGSGVFGALNLVLFAEALARAPASTLAPLDYTGLVWALLVDWLIFSQIPGPLGILGSVLITAAALIIVLKPAEPATPGRPVQ